MQEFFDELQLEKIQFDGCALGLRSDTIDPVRKPGCVATNSGHIFRAFAKYSCPGKDKHPYREPCAGKYTKRAESYTWPFTDVIHRHGEIAKWRFKEVSGPARLGILEN